MKAAQFNSYGETNVIEINANAEKPKAGAGQISVEVHAAAINPVESAIRKGYMQQMLPLAFPVTTGGDFSGVVAEVGEGVMDFKVGDEVYGIAHQFMGGSGTAAEFALARAEHCALKPANISHEHAAALPLAGTSAIQALEEHIKLNSGQKVLIHGGAGGIGSLAIQIAKVHGAYVVATASAEDMDFVKNLGADEVIDYKTQDFTALVKDFDAVLDTAGGEVPTKSLSVLKEGGVLVGLAGGADEALAKEKSITVIKQMSQGSTAQLLRLKELVEIGEVKPIIAQTFTLDQTAAAYDCLANESPNGKVVLKIK